MHSESLSFQVIPGGAPVANVVALNDVQQLCQSCRQSGRRRNQGDTQPFADLRTDRSAMDAVDFDTVWISVDHDVFRLLQLPLLDQVPERALVHYEWLEAGN
jgi:hypothetical protein